MKLKTNQAIDIEEPIDDYDDEPVDDSADPNRYNEQPDDEFDNFDDYGDEFDDIGGLPPMEKHADLLKELTNFAPYLKDTVNGWLGLSWDEGCW